MASEYTDTVVSLPLELLEFGGLIKGNAMAAFYLVASHEELREGATVSLWTVILTDLFLRNEEDGFVMQVDGVLMRMTKESKSIRMIISEFKRKSKDTPEERRRNEKQLAERRRGYFNQDGTPSYCFAMSAMGTHAKIFTFKKSVGVLEPLWESSEDDKGHRDTIDDGDFLRGYISTKSKIPTSSNQLCCSERAFKSANMLLTILCSTTPFYLDLLPWQIVAEQRLLRAR